MFWRRGLLKNSSMATVAMESKMHAGIDGCVYNYIEFWCMGLLKSSSMAAVVTESKCMQG